MNGLYNISIAFVKKLDIMIINNKLFVSINNIMCESAGKDVRILNPVRGPGRLEGGKEARNDILTDSSRQHKEGYHGK